MFDKKQMQRLINHVPHLAEKFLKGESLEKLYSEEVEGTMWEAKYEELKVETVELICTPLIKEIKILVDKYGWQIFINGVKDFCLIKCVQMKKINMFDAAAVWHKIYSKLSTLRRRVQM